MGSSRIPRPEDKAELITQRNRWDTAGFGGVTVTSLSPHTPWAVVTLLTVLSVAASSRKQHFYLCPAAVSHPPVASLPLWRLLQAVAPWLWHPHPQLATSLGEGHSTRKWIQFDWKDEAVLGGLAVPSAVAGCQPGPRGTHQPCRGKGCGWGSCGPGPPSVPPPRPWCSRRCTLRDAGGYSWSPCPP